MPFRKPTITSCTPRQSPSVRWISPCGWRRSPPSSPSSAGPRWASSTTAGATIRFTPNWPILCVTSWCRRNTPPCISSSIRSTPATTRPWPRKCAAHCWLRPKTLAAVNRARILRAFGSSIDHNYHVKCQHRVIGGANCSGFCEKRPLGQVSFPLPSFLLFVPNEQRFPNSITAFVIVVILLAFRASETRRFMVGIRLISLTKRKQLIVSRKKTGTLYFSGSSRHPNWTWRILNTYVCCCRCLFFLVFFHEISTMHLKREIAPCFGTFPNARLKKHHSHAKPSM